MMSETINACDAAITRMIRRILAAPGTSSDALLLVAEALNEAAIGAPGAEAVAMVGHAQRLRAIAPWFVSHLAIASDDPALALVRKHGLTHNGMPFTLGGSLWTEAMRELARAVDHEAGITP